MTEPRYRRRKEDRPAEITEAAFQAFAENGYAATRIDDVAKRAGVSKGLLYLYFKTKEELFKAVVKSVVIPKIDALTVMVDAHDYTAEDFLRGPALDFMKRLPGSPVAVIIRLLVAEGPRHPDLVTFYRENVIDRGLAAIKSIVDQGIESGEFRHDSVHEQPHLLIAPVIFSVIWKLIFNDSPLDTDKLIETHIDMVIAYIKA